MANSNVKGAVLTAAAGAAAVAVAVGLSKKENREKLGKVIDELATKAQKASKQISNDPDVKDAVRRGKKVAKYSLNEAKKEGKPVIKKAKKRVIKKIS